MRTMAWPLMAEEVESVFRSIQFAYMKWDVYHRGDTSMLPEALVLSEEEHAELVSAAETVWAALRVVEAAIRTDADALARIGVPDGLIPMVLAQRPDGPRVTRCDLHRTPDGRWLISEFNDDVPSGFGECAGLAAVLQDAYGDRFAGLTFRGDLRRRLVEAFAPWRRVGLVCATAYSEDVQHVGLVQKWLDEAGHETLLGSPANLGIVRGEPCLFEQPIDALFRYFPGEWIAELPNAAAWAECAPVLPMMNPLSALASQSKRFYAEWEDCAACDDPAHRQALARYLPRTVPVDALDRASLIGEQGRWVLKGAFGRMGNTVHIGALMNAPDWSRVVDAALAAPGEHAAQERFQTAPVWTARGMCYPTVGVYLVDGRFAGHFSRVGKSPLIDGDSWHVPTLVAVS